MRETMNTRNKLGFSIEYLVENVQERLELSLHKVKHYKSENESNRANQLRIKSIWERDILLQRAMLERFSVPDIWEVIEQRMDNQGPRLKNPINCRHRDKRIKTYIFYKENSCPADLRTQILEFKLNTIFHNTVYGFRKFCFVRETLGGVCSD